MSVGFLSAEFITNISILHERALPFGKSFALFGAGFAIGKNIIKVVRGNARAGVAVSDVIRDVIIAFGLGYGIGAAGIGEKLSATADLSSLAFLTAGNSPFGDVASIMINRIVGMIYFSGADTGLMSIFLASVPLFGFGLLFGIIFGFLF